MHSSSQNFLYCILRAALIGLCFLLIYLPTKSFARFPVKNPSPPSHLFYQDESGELLGPFPIDHVDYWFHQGYLNPATLCSSSLDGPFMPLVTVLQGENGGMDVHESYYGDIRPERDDVYAQQYHAERIDNYEEDHGEDDQGYSFDQQAYSNDPRHGKKKSIWRRMSERVMQKIPLRTNNKSGSGVQGRVNDRSRRTSSAGPAEHEWAGDETEMQRLGEQSSADRDGQDNMEYAVAEDKRAVGEIDMGRGAGMHDDDERGDDDGEDAIESIEEAYVDVREQEGSGHPLGGGTKAREAGDVSVSKRPNLDRIPVEANAGKKNYPGPEEQFYTSNQKRNPFASESEDEYPPKSTQRHSSSSAKISVGSIRVSLDDLWGKEAVSMLSSELKPADEVSRTGIVRRLLETARSIAGRSTVGRLAHGIVSAPLVFVSVVAHTALLMPIIAGACYLIDMILAGRLHSAVTLDLSSVDLVLQHYPHALKEALVYLVNIFPPTTLILSKVVSLVNELRSFAPIMSSVTLFLLLHYIAMARHNTTNKDKTSAVQSAVTQQYATIAGVLMTLALTGLLLYAQGCNQLSATLAAVSAIAVLEVSLLPSEEAPVIEDEDDLLHSVKINRLQWRHLHSLLSNPSSRYYLLNTRLLDAAEKYQGFLDYSIKETSREIRSIGGTSSYRTTRKWILSVTVFLLSFRTYIMYGDGTSRIRNDTELLVRSFHKFVLYLYFRFGLELTTLDDASVLKSITAATVLLFSLAPSLIFTKIMDACIQISKLRLIAQTHDDADLSGNAIFIDEHRGHSGWASGANPSAGIVLDGVSVFRGDKCTVNDVQITFMPGEVTVLCGDCDGAQEDILDAIWGTSKVHRQGSVSLLGRDANEWDTDYIRLRMTMFRRVGMRKVSLLAKDLAGLTLVPEEIASRAVKVSGASKTLRLLSKGPSTLVSAVDGQGEHISQLGWDSLDLCRTIIMGFLDREIILLDNPAAYMSAKEEDDLFKFLQKLARLGKIVVIASRRSPSSTSPDRVLQLEDGRLVQDRRRAVMASPQKY